jgi:hypothetical protein
MVGVVEVVLVATVVVVGLEQVVVDGSWGGCGCGGGSCGGGVMWW